MKRTTLVLGLTAIAAALVIYGFSQGGAPTSAADRPSSNLLRPGLVLLKGVQPGTHDQVAAFSGGCFWGIESEFRKIKGVVATEVGYTGGTTKNPTYEQVCTNTTGHAETVLLEYNPDLISYDKLLKEFWDMHDPTTGNRQGPDEGIQYRSAIWTFSDDQHKSALKSKDALQRSGELGNAMITTQIAQAAPFYRAEEYHQQYVEKGGVAFCNRRRGGG